MTTVTYKSIEQAPSISGAYNQYKEAGNAISWAKTHANTSGAQHLKNLITEMKRSQSHGGMGCGSHHGKSKSHKKKRSKMHRGGMGCGSHHGTKKSKKKHSKTRRGGMGCGSHHGKSHKKKKRGGSSLPTISPAGISESPGGHFNLSL